MADKKKSRFKKILKNLGKVAALGGAAYGASKLFGGGKKKYGVDAGFLKSGAAGGASLAQPTRFHPSQGNRTFPQYTGEPIRTGGVGVKADTDKRWYDAPWPRMAKGGRVTGIAKRGFGRALMKGKK